MATMTALQKRAARKARGGASMDMNLVSLIDVFTILIFFLLSSATGVELLSSPKAVKLPASLADKAPKDTVVLVVSDPDGRNARNLIDRVGAGPAEWRPK